MGELTLFAKTGSNFLSSSLSSIEYFRKGVDLVALDYFFDSMNELKALLDISITIGKMDAEIIKKFTAAIEKLHLHMQNNDFVAITDLMEFSLYPLVKGWIEECV